MVMFLSLLAVLFYMHKNHSIQEEDAIIFTMCVGILLELVGYAIFYSNNFVSGVCL